MADKAVDVQISGVREFRIGARRLFENIDEGADREFVHTADQVAAMVRGRVPHLTGRLAASAAGEPVSDGGRVMLGAGLPYAGWIEYGGTRGRPYVPDGRYLYPTALSASDQLRRAGEHAASSAIRGTTWPTPTPL